MKPGAVSELARTVLAQHYDNPTPTPEFHEELWELCCLDHNKVAIAAPRGHAKTTAVTGSYTISMLVWREADYVVVLSDTEGQAEEFISDIKREFLDNDHLRDIFGVKKLARDTQTDIIVEFMDGHLARVVGKGAEQKVRGRKWRGKRPNLIVIDDLENEELVDSDTRREKLQRWFYGSVLPAGGDNCLYRMVGTVLHFASLLESLMPGEQDSSTVIEDLRTYNLNPEENGGWMSVKYRAHTPEFEKILWEEKFPEQRLKAIRADYAKKGIPEVYSQEYLNEPLSDDNAFFAKRDFRPNPEVEDHWTRYAAADLAISERDKAAYTVIVVGAVGPDNRVHIIDLVRGRWGSDKIVEEVFAIQELHHPETFWMEAENIQRSLGPIFNTEMLERNVFINLEAVTPIKDKRSRAALPKARMKAGGLMFDQDAEWYPDLEQELRRFPKGPYKDQVDALALLMFGLDQMSEPLSAQELADQEYEEEFGDDIQFGRSAVTGY